MRFARQCACHVASVRGWQCMASGPVIFRSDTGESWCLVITDIVQIIVVTTPGYRDIVRIYYLYNVSFGTNIVITNSDNSSIWVFWAIFTFMLFHSKNLWSFSVRRF